MIQEELSKEEQNRVDNCDNYKLVKHIMQSHDHYKELRIGDVYFVKYTSTPGADPVYVSRTYGGKKDKFMIFHKDDEGFVFIKRINANGKLGKEIQCLTTQYPEPRFELEADPEYLESILLDNEKRYDPLKAEKELSSRKSKARRKNKKIELTYETAEEAFKAISEYKVGDRIYDAHTTYGEGVMEWTVDSIESRPTDKTKVKPYAWSATAALGKTREDQEHNKKGLPNLIVLKIKVHHAKPKSRKWTQTERTITFSDFMKWGNQYYNSSPYTTDDV